VKGLADTTRGQATLQESTSAKWEAKYGCHHSPLGMRGISFEPDGSPIVIRTPILLHGGATLMDYDGGVTTY
jgi:hypothetical protein